MFRGNGLIKTLLFALILTVAAIPVALPAVLSVTMAVGASRLAAMKAIVSRLVSIEEMAGMDMLCCDKTGTLTENELTLGRSRAARRRGQATTLLLAAALTCEHDAPDAIDAAVLKGVGDSSTLADYTDRQIRRRSIRCSKRAEAEVESGEPQLSVSPRARRRSSSIWPSRMPRSRKRRARPRTNSRVAASAPSASPRPAPTGTGASSACCRCSIRRATTPPQTIATAKRMGLQVRMVTGDHTAIAREIAGKLGLGTEHRLGARDLHP